jgi:hypothetical protein
MNQRDPYTTCSVCGGPRGFVQNLRRTEPALHVHGQWAV